MLNNMAEVSGVDNNRIREEKYTDESHFADWAKDSIYRVSAIYNKETTLMTGTGNGRFSPWMNYTREQAAATMYRLFECSSVPVLVPPRDNNIYCGVYNSETDGDILYCINTDTDSAKALVNNGEYTAIRVCAVSGNEIYYELTYNYRVKQMYKINTDGTGNTALTPQSEQVYLGNRYIYYVPVSAGDTVVRINLDGTSPITADFSVIDKYKVTCVIKVDRNDTIYVRVVTSYPEVDYLYKYDFSDGSMEKIPEDTNIAWMTNNAVYNGKYKFYVYRDFDGVYMNEVRNMGRNELHRCRIDGTNDVVLNKDLLLYEKKGLICLYENKVYVPTDNEGLSVLIYDSNGKSVEICPNPECEKLDYFESSIAFLGTQKGKIYYTYDGKIHCVNSDGTNDKEII